MVFGGSVSDREVTLVTLQYYGLGIPHVIVLNLIPRYIAIPLLTPHKQQASTLSGKMSATESSLGYSSQTLQQFMPTGSRAYIDGLAEKISRRRNCVTDDDVWEAYQCLKGIPRETVMVR